jgi:hypothetical protein
MDRTITLNILGLGAILYSPRATRHIGHGENYLEPHFWEPADVARHVNDCQISGFCTGSPGRYLLRLYDGPIDAAGLESAGAKVRLGIEVHDDELCFRDLYDLMAWEPDCADAQRVRLPSGFYRITVYTSRPASGIVGDGQTISLHFEAQAEKPRLAWSCVPDIVPE